MESNNGYFNQNQYQPNPYGNQPDPYSQPNPYDQQTYSNQQYNAYQQNGNYQANNAYQQNNPYQANNQYQQGPMNEPKDDGGKVLGIISVILSLFIPLVALVLGIIGLTKAKKNRNNVVPTALNWIGIGTSILTMVLSTIMIIGIIKEINAEDDYSESHSNHVYADSDKDKDDIDDYEVLDPFEDENDDLNPIQSADSTNTEEFENDLDELNFGSDNDDTAAETNNDTAVYSQNFSDSTESHSGSYTPSYETVSHGDDVQGYIEVPATYFDFYEADGYSDKLLAHQQYAYGMLDIITHYTFPGEDVPDLEAFAAGYQISFSTTAEKCDVYNATFGDNQGYLVYAEYSDGAILRAFIFEDNKGNVQYLCVEGVYDEYSDVYKTVFCNYVQP